MPQSVTIRSLPRAFELVKGMQDCQQDAAQAGDMISE